MDIVVKEELQAYIDPLTPEEHAALERSLLAEGCRDALVLWGDVLVDGHNRYGICRRHGLPFQTVQGAQFRSIEDVQLWMIDQHLGRRSLSDFQRGVLALRKREIVAGRRERACAEPAAAPPPAEVPQAPSAAPAAPAEPQDALDTREALARAARLSSSQVTLIEKIQRQAAPEVVAAVKAGELSINAAAAVASLPAEEQVAAAAAGGEQLRQAARRVRESRRRAPRDTDSAAPPAAPAPASSAEETLESLRERVALLTQENEALRRQVQALQARLSAPVDADTGHPLQPTPF